MKNTAPKNPSWRSCFVESRYLDEPTGRWFPLPEEALRHLVKVLRMEEDDPFWLRDEAGRKRAAKLSKMGDRWGFILSAETLHIQRPEGREVWLAPALIKGTRFDWLLEKASELGADHILPISCKRCVVRWTPEQFEKKRPRMERILREATRQSQSHRPPRLKAPKSIKEQAQFLSQNGVVILFADPQEGLHLRDVLGKTAGGIAFFSGPEGGFTSDELEILRSQGAQGVSLGPRILRAETAPIAFLAAQRLWQH